MTTTYSTKRARTKRMQKECDRWNAANPIGASVMVKLDGHDEPIATTTRSGAQVLSGHSAVIWLEGVSGCYLLTHVRAAATPEQQAIAAADLTQRLQSA